MIFNDPPISHVLVYIYRKRSRKVTCNIDGKIGILAVFKVTVKLTEFHVKLHVKLNEFLNKITYKFNRYKRFIICFTIKKID